MEQVNAFCILSGENIDSVFVVEHEARQRLAELRDEEPGRSPRLIVSRLYCPAQWFGSQRSRDEFGFVASGSCGIPEW